jgi:hypothetical protein
LLIPLKEAPSAVSDLQLSILGDQAGLNTHDFQEYSAGMSERMGSQEVAIHSPSNGKVYPRRQSQE